MDPSAEDKAARNVEQNENHHHLLDTFVNETLVNCEATAAQLLKGSRHTDDQHPPIEQQIQQTCKTLYDRVRVLSQLYEQHVGTSSATTTTTTLPELLLMDAETIWGQVELQNESLKKVLERSCKRLAKDEDVQVLAVLDSEDEEGDDSEDEEGASEEDGSDDGVQDEDEQCRIEARMQRAMQDMDEDDEDSDEEDDSRKETASNVDPEEFKQDEEAVNLHDGFFNLQEMEAFADEEEEYLPTQKLDPSPKEPAKKDTSRSFHQKQREGDMELDDESESDAGSEDAADDDAPVRRKYRKNKEIDALLSLYSEPKEVNDDSDDDDVIQMTAADLFGKPNPEYYKRWNSRKRETGSDNDSWNEYDFEKSKDDENTGWNSHDEENSGHDDNADDDEEVVDMKDAAQDKTSRPPTKQAAAVLRQTEQLEKELLAEKPWQMKGESGASSRPVNSLLETTPEFEVNAKVAPAITVEFTENLEEMIQKRILAEDWDDVVPRELPDVGWNMKRGEAPEVSQEKSKLSLGELYEREYLKKAVGYDKDAVEKETEEEKVKNEMRTLFANLCSKLDALSNYHFAPRPVADEADVRQVAKPAIAMEEVLPLHVSDARASAPEEVFGAKRGRDAILRDDTELEQTDRKRLRSAKKAARRKARKAKEADEKLISRLQPGNGLSNPYEKRKMREELSMARAGGKVTTGSVDDNNYGDSTTFFKRMQSEAKESISKDKVSLFGDEPQKKGSKRGESSKLIL